LPKRSAERPGAEADHLEIDLILEDVLLRTFYLVLREPGPGNGLVL